MRWILLILLTLIGCGSQAADNLIILKLSGGQSIPIRMHNGSVEVLGMWNWQPDAAIIIGGETPPTPPTPTPDEPTGPGQLICVRPWSCTLDESDADLTIRESLDAAKSQIPYFRLLPGTPDERLQPHPAERYRTLAPNDTKAWVFHVVPTATTPRILHQGPLDDDVVLSWVKVPKVAFAGGEATNEAAWLDVEFSKHPGEMLGSIELPAAFRAQALAAAANVRTLPGFRPIPKSEWAEWAARFPVTRMAKSVRNITEQTMGSCVGHACGNCIEGDEYMMAGDLFFRRISGMSMYKRIGRSPNSGAYIPDAADEIFARGILPVTGQRYPHEFAQDTGWSTPLPSGWETTGRLWKAAVFSIDDQESAFRWLMDCRYRTQFGRSSHSISGFCVMLKNGKWYWVYENSWGDDWGDLGVSAGYDTTFYDSFVHQPVLRDEIPVLLARELPTMRVMSIPGPSKLEQAALNFEVKIRAIMDQVNKGK